MAEGKRSYNKAFFRGDGASNNFADLHPSLNAWPDREAMGPSSKNNASQLSDKMEDQLTVKEMVS